MYLNLERNPFTGMGLKDYAKNFASAITSVCTGKLNWVSEIKTILKNFFQGKNPDL